MSGYRDTDDCIISNEMWDSLQNMLASIRLRLDALETSQHPPSDWMTLDSKDSICESCRAKTVCSSSSTGHTGHVVLECADYIVEGTPCTHEWHGDQENRCNICIRCGLTADHF